MKKLKKETLKALEKIRLETDPSTHIVFVSGNFNIVHPGHLRLLRYAASCGDFLVVGLTADGNPGVMMPEDLRLDGIRSNSWVNKAFIMRDLVEDTISALKPSIVVKGHEHENSANPELDILNEYGGKLLFSSGEISYSSLDLLRSEFKHLNLSSITHPQDYFQRHNIKSQDVSNIIKRMSDLKVLVVGDLIVDEYISCDPVGMSQEDPTIVVTPILSERFVGGAGIVAAHARGLGSEVHYFSVTGDDEIATFASDKFEEYGVNSYLYRDEHRQTTLKRRFIADDKTLLRVNELTKLPLSQHIMSKIWEKIKAEMKGCRLLIFSDFNYGCLPQSLVNTIVDECKKQNIMIVADSQSSSQMGDISRFHDMALITPTEHEARIALKNYTDGLIVLIEALRKKVSAANIALTLGSEGVIIHADDGQGSYNTDRLSALNTSPKDVSGAGDSFLASASLALALDADIWTSMYLGSLAAAHQVGRVGNIPLKADELYIVDQ